MKFTYIIGALCTKLRLLFHKVSFIISTLFSMFIISTFFFPPLRGVLYNGHVKLFAEALELFMHAVLQLVVICKTVSLE